MAPMSAQKIASLLSPSEFVKLCDRVTTKENKKFDVLEVRRTGESLKVKVVLEDRVTKVVTL